MCPSPLKNFKKRTASPSMEHAEPVPRGPLSPSTRCHRHSLDLHIVAGSARTIQIYEPRPWISITSKAAIAVRAPSPPPPQGPPLSWICTDHRRILEPRPGLDLGHMQGHRRHDTTPIAATSSPPYIPRKAHHRQAR